MDVEEVHALAKLVAAELGWAYDVRASRDRQDEGGLLPGAVIKPGLTPCGVRVRNGWQRPGYLDLVGDVPTTDKVGNHRWTYNGTMPTIHVRADRGPKVIAREIKRRLLPIYMPIYTKARETLAGCDADIDEQERVFDLLEPFGDVSRARHDLGRVYMHQPIDGTALVTTTGVELRLTVTAEQAVKILDMLSAEHRVTEHRVFPVRRKRTG